MIEVLFFLGLALYFFYRLNQSLGQRSEEDEERIQRKQAAIEKLLQEKMAQAFEKAQNHSQGTETQTPQTKLTISEKAEAHLGDLKKKDSSFDLEDFVRGAQSAFYWIVEGFAQGDLSKAKVFIDPSLYAVYEKEIHQRQQKKQTLENEIIRLYEVAIEDIAFEGDKVSLVVEYHSEQASCLKDETGQVISGNFDQVLELKDVWTFSRQLSSSSPNWTLVAVKNL